MDLFLIVSAFTDIFVFVTLYFRCDNLTFQYYNIFVCLYSCLVNRPFPSHVSCLLVSHYDMKSLECFLSTTLLPITKHLNRVCAYQQSQLRQSAEREKERESPSLPCKPETISLLLLYVSAVMRPHRWHPFRTDSAHLFLQTQANDVI